MVNSMVSSVEGDDCGNSDMHHLHHHHHGEEAIVTHSEFISIDPSTSHHDHHQHHHHHEHVDLNDHYYQLDMNSAIERENSI